MLQPTPRQAVAKASAPSSARAEIAFGRGPGGETFIRRQFAAYPFHVCRPHSFAGDPPGMVTLYLQSLSGGIYEHERLSLSLAAEPGARVHVTSQASTIVQSMQGGQARLDASLEAREGALVEYMPDPLILFPDADLATTLTLRWHEDAKVILADAFLAHDPEGAGRVFSMLDSRLDIETPEGRLLARDRFVLSGEAHKDRLSSEAGGGGALGTLVVITGPDGLAPMLAAVRGALEDQPGTYAGASVLPKDCGIRARLLSADGAALRRAMQAAWAAAREVITGAPPPERRK